jgi:large subunit ribosomal protein L11
MDFCKQFNARTKDKDKTMLLPVLIMVKRDKTFSFIVKEPPVSSLLLKYANISKGSSTAGRDSCGKVSMSDINAIAKIKINELMGASIEGAEKMICATAKSMGIEVI